MIFHQKSGIESNIVTTKNTRGFRLHVSDKQSDQSNQVGHLSHLDSRSHSRSKKNYNSVQCRLRGNFVFSCWYHTEYFVSPMMISILKVLWF
jgi:hypothetical protein